MPIYCRKQRMIDATAFIMYRVTEWDKTGVRSAMPCFNNSGRVIAYTPTLARANEIVTGMKSNEFNRQEFRYSIARVSIWKITDLRGSVPATKRGERKVK